MNFLKHIFSTVLSFLLSMTTVIALAASPSKNRYFELPHWVQLSEVASPMEHNGVAMWVDHFTSERSSNEVLALFREEWTTKTKEPLIESKAGEWDILGYEQNGYYHSVQVRSLSSDQSQGLISTTNVLKVNPGPNTDFPRMPGSSLLSVTKNTDGSKKADVIVLENHSSIEVNTAFYTQKLQQTGWVIQQQSEKKEITIFATKENAIAQVTLQPNMDKNTTVIQAVVVTES